ncbi:MAG TPA: tetratricopeptide repeat protein [Vicinamibacterales bacterium]|nr:tetratricopeptide repeat protein [Vicinamibacterales bacterium]
MNARRGLVAVTLATFAVAYCVLQVASYTQKSATWDEPVHLAAGYLAAAHGDYRVEATHPPLMRMWAALPLVFMSNVKVDRGVIDRTDPAAWHSGSTAYTFATKFLFVDNDANRLLGAARFMIVLCAVGLGILIFCWAYEWLGFAPAACALVCYTLSPNLLANSSLVTTDAGITCFIFGAVYFLWRTSRRFSAVNVAAVAAFVAAAVVTKFSGLILGPIVVALLIAASGRTTITPRRAAAIVATIAAASYVAIWAVFGFRYAPSDSPTWVLHLERSTLARTVPSIAAVTGWIDGHHLLPNLFTEGFLMFAQSMAPPNYTFLAGHYSSNGWWYYFPVAFLIKTPIAFIVLVASGLVVSIRMRRSLGGINETFVLLPIAIYLVPAITSTYQVGIRHILPLYPFLILIAATAVKAMLRRPVGRVSLAALSLAWVVVFFSVYPHTLTFFNRFVGGPSEGYRYLADSNLDWGQGLKNLRRWMGRHDVATIGLAYFGSADPAYYGIKYTPLPAATPGFALPATTRWVRPQLPGYVAVSATVLSGVYLDPQWRLFYEGLRHIEPVAVLGNSIFVYRLDRWPEPPPVNGADDVDRVLADDLLKAQWYERAALHYRRSLKRHPDEPAVLVNLGAALLSTGRPAEAIPPLERAVTVAPDVGIAQFVLATALFQSRHDIDKTVRHARRAVALLPGDIGALVLLARALAVRGDLGEAATVVGRALSIDANNADAQDLRSRIEMVMASRRPPDS